MPRGEIQRRGDSWSIRYDLPPDPATGKRRQKRETFDTKREAEKALAQRLTEVDGGTYMEPAQMILEEFLDEWMQTHSQNLKATTESQYRHQIDNHIKPNLGKIRLADLEPIHLQRFYRKKLTSGRLDGKEGGLSKRSVEYIHSIIHRALGFAVKWQMIKTNPADVVDPPRPEHKEMKYWDSDEVQQFLDHVREDRLYALYRLALTTGMRQGELLGLRWEDVDLEEGVLRVRQVLSRTSDGNISFGPPKTAASRRTIALGKMDVQALRQHTKRQKEEKLKAPEYLEHDLVFATALGTPIRPRNILRYFKKHSEEAGVPEIRFHDLRHTHATMMLKAGVPAKTVSKRHGHRDISTTLDTYTHVTDDMQRDAAEALEREIEGR